MKPSLDSPEVVLVHLEGSTSPACSSPYESILLGNIDATLVAAGYTTRIIDAGLEDLGLAECIQLAAGAGRMVVVDVLFRTQVEARRLFAEVRRQRGETIAVVAVGEAAQACAGELLASGCVDVVPTIDPEPVVLRVLRSATPELCGSTAPAAVAMIAEQDQLDRQPTRPHLRTALRNRPVIDVASSRGCSYRCSFCTISASSRVQRGGRPIWRPRTAAAVTDEAISLCEEHDVSRVCFLDDNFLAGGAEGRRRALAIGRRLNEAGAPFRFSLYARADAFDEDLTAHLVAAGLRQVGIGIESGSPTVLRLLRKQQSCERIAAGVETLRSGGVRCVPSFVVFEQRQSPDDLIQTLDFMIDLDLCDGFSVGSALPIPGTQIAAELRALGLTEEPAAEHILDAPVFLDSRVKAAHGLVQAVESALDDMDGLFTTTVMDYHRYNDHLLAAAPTYENRRRDRAHSQMRRQEARLLRDWLAEGGRTWDLDTVTDWVQSIAEKTVGCARDRELEPT